ncbi:MAG TPA: calcium/sodium antiporter [Deltaproteobacteria bacterium]|nr:calcium/sodium antiporter [Deltaproteobacteria bacterium]
MVSALFLTLGVAMLFGGGELLVRGASGVARALRVSPLIIGLTIVAFGTSAPELVVNLVAVLQGSSGVAFGNVIGSNLANIGLILGLAAVFRPIQVDGTVIVREIPMMILVSAVAVLLGLDGLLQGMPDVFSRSDCLVLLLLFGVFLYYNIFDAVRARRSDRYLEEVEKRIAAPVGGSLLSDMVRTLAGLALLVAGGKLTVMGAVGTARGLGVSEGLIGLTVVAVGTSLPELAASCIAAWRNEPELALGNVVGSNIFNLCFVMGLAGAIAPVQVPGGGALDLTAMLTISLVLMPMALTASRRITRLEGFALVVAYAAYIAFRSLAVG